MPLVLHDRSGRGSPDNIEGSLEVKWEERVHHDRQCETTPQPSLESRSPPRSHTQWQFYLLSAIFLPVADQTLTIITAVTCASNLLCRSGQAALPLAFFGDGHAGAHLPVSSFVLPAILFTARALLALLARVRATEFSLVSGFSRVDLVQIT